jgi:nucleoside-diphosphate-sugar epimerase
LRKLKKLTGWTPSLSIEEGIKKTIDALHNINLQK